MKQIRIENLARPEEALSGAAMKRVMGEGPEIVCTAAGCFPVWPQPLPIAPLGPVPYFPTFVGSGLAPFYGPAVTAPVFAPPIVAIVRPRRRRRW
jgi:hypothetical protein